MGKKFWMLSVCINDHDQHGAYAIMTWETKPTLDQVAKALKLGFPGPTDEITLFIVKLWNEEHGVLANHCFSLEEYEHGEEIDDLSSFWK